MSGRYLSVEDAARELHVTPRTIGRYVGRRAIPHRKLAGVRRVLIPADELGAWLDGAELETIHPISGGRIVRPVAGERP